MCFNQTGDISTLNGSSLKQVDKFTYQGSSVSSTETDIDMRLAKARTAITDADYADDIALLLNAPAQAETLLHSLERV